MNIFAKQGDRQVGTGTYYDEKLARLRRAGDETLQRQMRRRVADHGLQSTHTRAPATEFYWAAGRWWRLSSTTERSAPT